MGNVSHAAPYPNRIFFRGPPSVGSPSHPLGALTGPRREDEGSGVGVQAVHCGVVLRELPHRPREHGRGRAAAQRTQIYHCLF